MTNIVNKISELPKNDKRFFIPFAKYEYSLCDSECSCYYLNITNDCGIDKKRITYSENIIEDIDFDDNSMLLLEEIESKNLFDVIMLIKSRICRHYIISY